MKGAGFKQPNSPLSKRASRTFTFLAGPVPLEVGFVASASMGYSWDVGFSGNAAAAASGNAGRLTGSAAAGPFTAAISANFHPTAQAGVALFGGISGYIMGAGVGGKLTLLSLTPEAKVAISTSYQLGANPGDPGIVTSNFCPTLSSTIGYSALSGALFVYFRLASPWGDKLWTFDVYKFDGYGNQASPFKLFELSSCPGANPADNLTDVIAKNGGIADNTDPNALFLVNGYGNDSTPWLCLTREDQNIAARPCGSVDAAMQTWYVSSRGVSSSSGAKWTMNYITANPADGTSGNCIDLNYTQGLDSSNTSFTTYLNADCNTGANESWSFWDAGKSPSFWQTIRVDIGRPSSAPDNETFVGGADQGRIKYLRGTELCLDNDYNGNNRITSFPCHGGGNQLWRRVQKLDGNRPLF